MIKSIPRERVFAMHARHAIEQAQKQHWFNVLSTLTKMQEIALEGLDDALKCNPYEAERDLHLDDQPQKGTP